MIFNSLVYFLFLPLVFLLYWRGRTARWKNCILFLASMVFYGWWSLPCLALMVGTCMVNYLAAEAQQRWHRRLLLFAPILFNFTILGIFKYFNFFADNMVTLLHALGLQAHMPTLSIILPVGISFYVFQLTAYVVDCYQGRIMPTHSPVRFLTFICFFPQLVAGPIERGSNLLPQFEAKRTFDEHAATEGLRLILWGLMKKMLIADNCAFQVDYIFSNYDSSSLPTLWLGALYFTFQIYGDFSGYSDMAVGSARLFGIRITRNFNRPYFATSMQDFWRRWHITLMNWFRDYVYIPLGGNRRGKVRKQMNTLAVFTLSGLWHGSNWTFVCWGLYHALIYYLPVRRLAFLFVLLGWVIFRAPDMHVATTYIGHMFCPATMGSITCSRMPIFLIALLVLTEWRMGDRWHPFQFDEKGWQSSQAIRIGIYLVLLLITMFFGGEQTQFIYFQF